MWYGKADDGCEEQEDEGGRIWVDWCNEMRGMSQIEMTTPRALN